MGSVFQQKKIAAREIKKSRKDSENDPRDDCLHFDISRSNYINERLFFKNEQSILGANCCSYAGS